MLQFPSNYIGIVLSSFLHDIKLQNFSKNAIPKKKKFFQTFPTIIFPLYFQQRAKKNILFLSLVQHKLCFVYRRRCSRPNVYVYNARTRKKNHTVHIFAYDSLGAQSHQRMLNFNLSFVFTNLTTFQHYSLRTRHTFI